MARNNYNNKTSNFKMSKKTKSILITVGMILLILAVLVGLNALLKNNNKIEGYEQHKISWSSGDIDIDGSMKPDKFYMHSSKIDVETALMVKREFNSNIAFRVYFYNENDELVYSVNEKITSDYSKDISEIVSDEVSHARIAVEWLENNDDELTFFERLKLSKLIKVYVAVETEAEE